MSAERQCDSIVDPGPSHGGARELALAYGLSATAADLLARRGHVPGAETARWLDPKLAELSHPGPMVDRELAADRIARAIRAGERVAVFGDYDCDGITSTAILCTVIEALGGEAVPVLASRMAGGYGLSARALERVVATGATLLITCDCGSSDHERVAEAMRRGIDTIVIDHHLVPAEPLPALAFLNPHRPDCGFAFKGLASCGLAFSIAAALRQRLGKELDLRPWLDLVAIGTVADVAPLGGDNRALVRAGLKVLSGGLRPGLRALAELAKLELSRGVTSEDIGFRIAPRLNAPGRLGDPDAALALLVARDAETAAGLAASIEQVQLRRRAMQASIVDEAQAMLRSEPLCSAPALVLAKEGWHPGIVGIVAGKIAEATQKPTIVVGLEGAEGRGSVRGPRGFPLHDALTRCADALLGFGGHQAAAGVHVRADRVAELQAQWSAACEALSGGELGATPEAHARLDPGDDPRRVLEDLERFEPFGEGNPTPLFLLDEVEIRSARDLKGHLKLELRHAGRELSGIQFGEGARATELRGTTRRLVGSLRRDHYRGGVELHVTRLG